MGDRWSDNFEDWVRPLVWALRAGVEATPPSNAHAERAAEHTAKSTPHRPSHEHAPADPEAEPEADPEAHSEAHLSPDNGAGW